MLETRDLVNELRDITGGENGVQGVPRIGVDGSSIGRSLDFSRFASLDMLDWTTSGGVVLMTVLGDASGVVTGAILVAIVPGFRRGLWATGARLLARVGITA